MIRPMIKTSALYLAALALWLVGVFCFVHARPLLEFEDDFSPRDFNEFHGSVVGSVLGQFRMSVGDLLWLKTDEYLHSGVRHRRRTQRERNDELGHELREMREEHRYHNGEDEVGRHADPIHREFNDDNNHEDMVTVIPAAERDVRGFFGELDRQVSPFTLHAPHSDPDELAPWYRLLTYVNPNHTRAYVTGAFIIGEHGNQKDAALEFLLEGERNNPLSIDIKEALGRFYFYTCDNVEQALPYFEQAVSLGKQKTQLTPWEEFAFHNAYRNSVIAYWRGKNDMAAAKKSLVEGMQRFPQDKALRRLARQIIESTGQSLPVND